MTTRIPKSVAHLKDGRPTSAWRRDETSEGSVQDVTPGVGRDRREIAGPWHLDFPLGRQFV